MLTLYGIPNCDTVKKTRKWLDNHNVNYIFSNLRDNPPTQKQIQLWADKIGWEKLLNRRSTTFRQLDETDKTDLTESKAIELMLQQPTLVKRPVMELDDHIEVGFSEARYSELLC